MEMLLSYPATSRRLLMVQLGTCVSVCECVNVYACVCICVNACICSVRICVHLPISVRYYLYDHMPFSVRVCLIAYAFKTP